MTTLTKTCKSKFHVGDPVLPIEEFTKDKYRKDGYSDTCKLCARARKKDWLNRVYAEDSTVQSIAELRAKHTVAGQKRRLEKGLPYSLWFSAKHRAKKLGREFTITEDDVIIPGYCPILNIPLITEITNNDGPSNTATRLDNYPSIDRIDSTCGYTPDNIMVISWRANHLKNNATLQEMVALGEFAAKIINQPLPLPPQE